jgi:anti-sigma-K factor RskA
LTVKEYIESGILEAYALQALSPSERKEVEAMMAKYPQVKAAADQALETMNSFTKAYSVPPPPGLKQKVMAAALATPEAEEPKPAPAPQKSVNPKPWAIAATVLFLISGGFNFLQFQKNKSLDQSLKQKQIRLAELETQNQVLVTRYESSQEDLAMLTSANTAQFVMKGIEGRDPQMRADIFWNAETQKVYLDVKNMPAPPPGHDYQLWALKDGKPLDMGIFKTINQNGLQPIGQIPGADAFAVTLEPAGGSETPALENMYVYGEALAV